MSAPITTPQQLSREVLSTIGIEVTGGRTVVLTDHSVGERAFTYLINPSQLEYAGEQFRLVTGATTPPGAHGV